MNKVRIGICGLNRGRIHLMNLLINDKYEVVAICDKDKKVADDIYERYCKDKDVKVYYDVKDLCADKNVDTVLVATPIDVHAEHVICALEAKKNVFSEVIVATTIEDIKRIQAALKKSGKKYISLENYCYIRPLLIVENLVKEGKIGEIYYAESDYLKDFQEYNPNFPNVGGWRQQEYFGRKGHPYITHSLGPLLHLMGEKVVKVIAMGAGNHFDMVADETCVLMLETEKGHLIRLRSSFVSPRPDSVTYYSMYNKSDSSAEMNTMMIITALTAMVSFVIIYVVSGLLRVKNNQSFLIIEKNKNAFLWSILFIGLCGLVSGGYQRLNMYLTGALPSIVFFPTFNGVVIFLSCISGVVLFKEKLSVKQIVGLVLGVICIMLVGNVFSFLI